MAATALESCLEAIPPVPLKMQAAHLGLSKTLLNSRSPPTAMAGIGTAKWGSKMEFIQSAAQMNSSKPVTNFAQCVHSVFRFLKAAITTIEGKHLPTHFAHRHD